MFQLNVPRDKLSRDVHCSRCQEFFQRQRRFAELFLRLMLRRKKEDRKSAVMLTLMSVIGPAIHKRLKDAGVFQPESNHFPLNVDMYGIKIESPWMSPINNPYRGAFSMSSLNSLTRSTGGPGSMARCAFDLPCSTSSPKLMPASQGPSRDPPRSTSAPKLMPASQGPTRNLETVSSPASSSAVQTLLPSPRSPTRVSAVSSSGEQKTLPSPRSPTKKAASSLTGQTPLPSLSPTRGAASCPAMQGSSTASSINGTSFNKRVSFAEEVTCEFLSSDEEEFYPSTPGRIHKRYDNVRRTETNGRPMSPEIEAFPTKSSVDRYLFLPELDMLEEEGKLTTVKVLHELPKVNIDLPIFGSEEQNKPSVLETTTCSSNDSLPQEDVPSAPEEVGPAAIEEKVGPAAPEEVGSAAPEKIGLVAPEKVGPAAPEEVGSAAPEKVGLVAPEKVGPAAPEKVGPAAPEVVGPAAIEEGVSVSEEEQLSGYACAGVNPTKMDLAKSGSLKASTSLGSYKELEEDKEPARKVISLPELVYHPIFRRPGRTPEIEVERVPKSEDYVDECFLFEGYSWRESEKKPDYYQPYKRPTTLEEYYSHNREFRESITFGAASARLNRIENQNLSGQNTSNNGLIMPLIKYTDDGAKASGAVSTSSNTTGNQRAHQPFVAISMDRWNKIKASEGR